MQHFFAMTWSLFALHLVVASAMQKVPPCASSSLPQYLSPASSSLAIGRFRDREPAAGRLRPSQVAPTWAVKSDGSAHPPPQPFLTRPGPGRCITFTTLAGEEAVLYSSASKRIDEVESEPEGLSPRLACGADFLVDGGGVTPRPAFATAFPALSRLRRHRPPSAGPEFVNSESCSSFGRASSSLSAGDAVSDGALTSRTRASISDEIGIDSMIPEGTADKIHDELIARYKLAWGLGPMVSKAVGSGVRHERGVASDDTARPDGGAVAAAARHSERAVRAGNPTTDDFDLLASIDGIQKIRQGYRAWLPHSPTLAGALLKLLAQEESRAGGEHLFAQLLPPAADIDVAVRLDPSASEEILHLYVKASGFFDLRQLPLTGAFVFHVRTGQIQPTDTTRAYCAMLVRKPGGHADSSNTGPSCLNL